MNTSHGMSYTKIYNIWAKMKDRCLNKNNTDYKDYGGRGITFCESWKDFENFYRDMGDKPDGLEIDRIDNNGNYFKENCRWTTRSIQNTNKRYSNKTGFRGVRPEGNKFVAQIQFKGKKHRIGTFDTPKLASLAFQACRYVLHSSKLGAK